MATGSGDTSSSQSPGRSRPSSTTSSYYDPASLLASQYGAATSSAQAAYAHLAHMPSAFNMLGRHPLFAPSLPFGGLGSMPESLRSPGAVSQSPLSPTTAGADWWRAASEQARRMAATGCVAPEYYPGLNGGMGGPLFQLPTLTTGTTATTTTTTTSSPLGTTSPKASSSSASHVARSGSKKGEQCDADKASKKGDVTPNRKNKDSSLDRKDASRELEDKLQVPFSFEGLANAESAALMDMSPFFFPFGTVANTIPTFSSLATYSMSPFGTSTTTSSTPTFSSSSLFSTASSSPYGASGSSGRGGAEGRASLPSHTHMSPSSSRSTSSVVAKANKPVISVPSCHPAERSKSHKTDTDSHSVPMSVITSASGARAGLTPTGHKSQQLKGGHSSHNSDLSTESDRVKRKREASPKKSDYADMYSGAGSSFIDCSQDGAIDLSIKKPKSSAPTGSSRKSPPSASSSTSQISSQSKEKSKESKEKSSLQNPSSQLFGSADGMESHASLLEKQAAAFGMFSGGIPNAYSMLGMSPFFDAAMHAGMFFHPMMASAAASSATSPNATPAAPLNTGRSRGRVRGRGRGSRGGGRGRTRTSNTYLSIPNPTLEPGEVPPMELLAVRNRSRNRGGNNQQPSGGGSGGGGRSGGGGGGGVRSAGARSRGGGPGLASATALSLFGVPISGIDLEAQHAQQAQLQAQFTEQLKDKHMQLKLAQRAKALKDKDPDGSNVEGLSQSRLAQVLMGQSALDSSGLTSPNKEGKLSDTSASGTGETATESDTGDETGSMASSEYMSSEGGGLYHTRRSRGSSRKRRRRRTIFDETEIRIPLEHGWRRETYIHAVNQKGVIGEVIYYSPCGKKLKTYPEVERYLRRCNITDLARDNFTYSTQVAVGEFFEPQPGGGEEDFMKLTEADVMERYVTVEARRKRIWERKLKLEARQERKQQAEDMASRMADIRYQKKMEQQDLARKVAEMKMRKKLEQQQQKEAVRRAKQIRLMEMKRARERQRLMKQQERVHRQQQVQMERQMRTQQIIEDRRRKREELQSLRYAEAVRKAQDREVKRQQCVVLKDQTPSSSKGSLLPLPSHIPPVISTTMSTSGTVTLTFPTRGQSDTMYYSYLIQAAHQERERQQQLINAMNMERERRRQHMLLLKAMESRKKLEDKERLKEDKKEEKRLERVKKLEQRQMELTIAREMKKPVEDMCLADTKPLPEMPRISGVQLAGSALADCLMVVEFVQNFGHALGFDAASLPTMALLQGGLLNHSDHVEDLHLFIMQLLRYALDDPGVPNPREALTASGQKIGEVDLNEHSLTEVLRLFMVARNAKEDALTEALKDKPFQCLSVTCKASAMAFICNELLCGKLLSGEIEKNIEGINNMRRDKWIVEGKLRKYRMIQAKRFRAANLSRLNMTADGHEEAASVMNDSKPEDKKEIVSDEEEEESDEESDSVPDGHDSDTEEEEGLCQEEIEKRIEKCNKNLEQFRDKVNATCHKMRGMSFGQDRYKRRYWVLPHCGGVFVESMESAEEKAENCENDEWWERVKDELKKKAEQVKCEEKHTEEMKIASIKEEMKIEKMEEELLKQEVIRGDILPQKCELNEVKDEYGMVKENGHLPPCASAPLASPVLVNGNCNTDVDKQEDFPHLRVGYSPTPLAQNGHMELNHEASPKPNNNLPVSKPQPPSDLVSSFNKVHENGVVNHDETATVKKLENLVNGGIAPSETPSKSGADGFRQDKMSPKEAIVNNVHNMGPLLSEMSKAADTALTNSVMCGSATSNSDALSFLASLHNQSKMSPGAGSLLRHGDQQASPLLQMAEPQGTSTPHSASFTGASHFKSIDSILSPNSYKSNTNSLFNNSLTSPSVFNLSSGVATPTSSSSPFLMKTSTPSSLLATTTMTTTAPRTAWVRILPRKPCDDHSITQPSVKTPNTPVFRVPTLPPITPSRAPGTSPNTSLVSPMGGHSFTSTPGSAPYTPGSNMTGMLTNNSLLSLFASPMMMDSISVENKALLDSMMENKDLLGNLAIRDNQPVPPKYSKGWWKVTDANQIKQVMDSCHPRGVRERCLQKNLERCMEYITQSTSKFDRKGLLKLEMCPEARAAVNTESGAPFAPQELEWNPALARDAELGVLDEVENMEDRIHHASLQVKGWKLPTKVADMDDVELVASHEVQDVTGKQRFIVDVAREKVLSLERNIERRYLKPPFAKGLRLDLQSLTQSTGPPPSHDLDESHSDNECHKDDSYQDEDGAGEDEEQKATKELTKWRFAVSVAKTASQVMVFLLQLNDCIAWEKSIMKVNCQICCKDDNEAELLLCDSCDKGYHTYCFRPKMDNIPDGDWYCYECISKVTGESCCVVCGLAGAKLADCEFCPRAMHTDCMDPPLARLPKKWSCAVCVQIKGKSRKRKSRPSTSSFANILDTPTKSQCTPSRRDSPRRDRDQVHKMAEGDTGESAANVVGETCPEPDKKPKTHKKRTESESTDCDKDLTKDKKGSAKKKKEPPKDKKKKPVKEENVLNNSDIKSGGDSDTDIENKNKDQQSSPKPTKKKSKPKEVKPKSKGKKTNEPDDVMDNAHNDDPMMLVYKMLLSELEAHSEAWPFLSPVDTKRFSSYRKIIKQPMDLQTIRRKLRDEEYCSADEFADDMRLIFNNCETYNEDESAVGKAGHVMRQFFEEQWMELCSS